ncbi:hypothetical protein BJF82_03235 [Kytococcus sp. CUA-901]|nr:hypothetical protein BJF82_03235 [Kytococcus sp. CUA-901]
MTAAALKRVVIDHSDGDGPRTRTILSTGSLVLQGMVKLALSIAVGRMMGPHALAQVTAALAVASILSLLTPSAIGSAASRFLAATQAQGEPGPLRQVTGHLGRRLLQSCLLLAPLGVVYWVATGHGLADALTIGLLTIGIGGYAFARGVHTGAQQVRRLVTWDLFVSMLGVVGTVGMAALGFRPVTTLLPLAFGYLLITVASWPPTAAGRPTIAAEMDHFIRWGTLGTVISAGLMHLAMLVAEARLEPDLAGSFAAALNLLSPAGLLATSLTMVLFPSIAAAFGRGDNAGALRLTRTASDDLVFIMVALFGSLSILAPWVVTILWGERFVSAGVIFPILALGPLSRAVSMPSVTSMSARDRDGIRHSATSTLMGFGLAVLIWLAAPGPAWVAVAAGFSAAMTFTAVQNIVRATRHDGHRWTPTWARFAFGVGSVLAVLVVRDQWSLGLMITTFMTASWLVAWSAMNGRAVRHLLGRRAP